MGKLHSLIVSFAIGLAVATQMGFAQASRSATPASAPAPVEDAEAEAKARAYFTDLEVIDQNGNRLRFYSDVLKDRVVLINFIFTNCPGACPMVTQKLIQTRQLMVETVKDEVWFVSISVDPERDTPEAMKAFAAKQGADERRWLFLTGEKANLEHIVRKLGQYTPDVDAHSTLMLAGNTRNRHWTRVMPMVPPAGIAEKMRALVEEAPG
jgi:cytochrome oxidase Cu insertion factor (SCO1/SenC/PrrC family)